MSVPPPMLTLLEAAPRKLSLATLSVLFRLTPPVKVLVLPRVNVPSPLIVSPPLVLVRVVAAAIA